MDTSKITPLILTFNEEANIGRTLERLDWAERIVVIDSYSTDATLDILRSFPNVEVFQRYFDSFTPQWNYGLSKVRSEWVLSLDADYVCPVDLVNELKHLPDDPVENGFKASFQYCISGQPLRGALYPSRTVLYRPNHARYVQDGHTQVIEVDGKVGRLSTLIDHDDQKPLEAWFAAQRRYVHDEVAKLRSVPREELGFADRIRLLGWLAPLLTPFYCLIVKRGIFDGRAGWYYAMQRTYAEIVLSMTLLDREITGREASSRNMGFAAMTPMSGDGESLGYQNFPHDISQVVVTVNG